MRSDAGLGAFASDALVGMARIDRADGPKDRHKARLTGIYFSA